MNDATKTFINDLLRFSNDSLMWCRRESEAAIGKVNDIVSMLINESDRVSAVSKETVEAVQSMREIIDNLMPEGNRTEANKLAIALQDAAKHDEQIHNFVSPIIETLQFQDRIAQNMDNLGRMIRVWIEHREQAGSQDTLDKEFLRKFGNKLMECTTMIEERDIVREQISGLDGEAAKPEVLFF